MKNYAAGISAINVPSHVFQLLAFYEQVTRVTKIATLNRLVTEWVLEFRP